MTEERVDGALAAHVAQFHVARRELDAARAALDTALRVAHDEQTTAALIEALCGLTRGYAAKRRVADADAVLTQARALAETPMVWRTAAALASMRRDMGGAAAFWRRAADGEPDVGANWLGLARALEAADDRPGAYRAYLRAVEVEPSYANVLGAAERLLALAPDDVSPADRVRVALVGSATLDHVASYLQVHCRLTGLAPEIYVAPYGQYAQEILDEGSGLYAFRPDIVILAVHGRAFFPELYDGAFDLPVAARREAAHAVAGRMAELLETLTDRTGGLILTHTFATPQYSPMGTLDLRDEFGQSEMFAAINADLAMLVRERFPSVQLVDEERVYGRAGKANATDARMWFMARIGVGEGGLGALTNEYMRFMKALKGRSRKCLVLDLDNTLWGGVVGEDGPQGIALGHEAPGNAYRAFQEAILAISKRGIILAVNSKNNEADALEVLQSHPDMVLRPSDFAAMRINWLDKAENLRSIAAELNIGLDSMVFVDDSRAECARVRAELPEVLVVELPREPAHYRVVLLALTDFDALTITDEDRQRGQLYAERRERHEWEQQVAPGVAGNAGDAVASHLAGLGLVVSVALASDFDLARVAQLIGKTNQFNLTTTRHTDAAVRGFAESPAHAVYTVRVRDRFGDHGLVGVAIVERGRAECTIETLLLSCRVLGCGVETALLSGIARSSRAEGVLTLRGLYAETAKNEPAREFYARHGFALASDEGGTQTWTFDLAQGDIAPPAWLTVDSASLGQPVA